MSTGKLFIAIAGNIGTGKTTLTQMLSNRFGWKAHYESVANNPYLADFYENMERWAFPLQIYFLTNRFQAHQEITRGMHSAIQDRSIYEDAFIFSRNLYTQGKMSTRDYQNYLELFDTMCQYLTPPDLVIYLKKSLPNLKKRIAQRGRDFERAIPDEYLEMLNRHYNDWMDSYSLGKKLIIESDDLDLIENPNDFRELSQKIVETLEQKDIFLERAVSL